MKYSFLFLMLIFQLYPGNAFSQNSKWQIHENLMGKNSSALWSLKIDKANGDVWIGATYADNNLLGIAKFDGQDWSIYENFLNRNYNLQVKSIAIDPAGNKWFTSNDGIVKYNNIDWQLFTSNNTILPVDNVNDIAIEPSGICWFGLNTWKEDTPVIARYNNGEWSVFKISDFIENHNEGGYIITSVAIDSSGNKWFGGSPGVFAIDKNNQLIYSSMPENFDTVTEIYVDKNNVVWLGSFKGLFYYDGSQMVEYILSSTRVIHIRGILLDDNENIWVTTDYGIYRAYDNDWIEYNYNSSDLPFNKAAGIDMDKFGRIWIATWDGHVAVYDPQKPVGTEFFRLRGVAYKNYTQILWETIEEQNNIGFTILRSDAQYGEFKEIGFVKGSTNSSKITSYSFNDYSANEYVRYRIRQESADGAFEYSNIIEGNVGKPKTIEFLQNFPNPFNESTKIAYSLNATQHTKIVVYNSIGQQVRTIVDEVQSSGRYLIEFDGDDLNTGVYYVRLITENGTKTHKMLYLE